MMLLVIFLCWTRELYEKYRRHWKVDSETFSRRFSCVRGGAADGVPMAMPMMKAIVASCAVLMRFDASRMYHSIRGQAAIKLYVIYNGLEVGDRLLSALGQDIFECLFSSETLSRDSSTGRSKVLLPFAMFCLALAYNVCHATALFYQVITLNVAVNSYSNSLLTLLISGGHTMLLHSTDLTTHSLLANTTDLAAGNALDAIARLVLPAPLL